MRIKVFTAFSGYDSQCLALNVLMASSIYPPGTQFTKDGASTQLPIPFIYELVGWSEIDKYAIKAHNALFPQWADRNYGDISKIDWNDIPDFDLFTYSSPCQDFSLAGRQAGGAKGSGTRSSLLWECERAIETKLPKYLIFENVEALSTKKFIRLFNEWQLTLSRLGYTNFTQVIDAAKVGYPTPIPQHRERLFMVSILNCDKAFYFPEEQPLFECLMDYLEIDVDKKYYLSNERIAAMEESSMKELLRNNSFCFKPKEITDIANTINTHNGSRKVDTYIKVVGNLNPNQVFGKGIRQQNILVSSDGIAPTITAKHELHPYKVLVDGEEQDSKRTIGIRKLTERECFRLMGLNDRQIDIIQKAGISRTQQIKMAGNSIVVNCLAAIFKQLLFGNSNKYQQTEIF